MNAPEHYQRDLRAAEDALAPWRTEHGYSPAAPHDLLRYYSSLLTYGYGRGWL